ncbi:MAG: dihydrofolate reductase [Gemmatimonadaceae bacterium]|nr:dihydrofolate reductase [Chitinophagaceae bacterium]
MNISLVVAASANNAIGKDNQLLWHLPNDMKFFKNTTWAMPVIMGRKTFESMNSKPLVGRTNIIVTRQTEKLADQAVKKAESLDNAIQIASQTDAKEVFVIGGGQIFAEALPLADKVFLTRVHAVIDGDVFFPELDKKDWKLSSTLDFKADEKHAYPYSFEIWVRNPSV